MGKIRFPSGFLNKNKKTFLFIKSVISNVKIDQLDIYTTNINTIDLASNE